MTTETNPTPPPPIELTPDIKRAVEALEARLLGAAGSMALDGSKMRIDLYGDPRDLSALMVVRKISGPEDEPESELDYYLISRTEITVIGKAWEELEKMAARS